MRRGLSERTWVGLGLEGLKGSCGQARLASDVETNVGVVKAAVFVYVIFAINKTSKMSRDTVVNEALTVMG